MAAVLNDSYGRLRGQRRRQRIRPKGHVKDIARAYNDFKVLSIRLGYLGYRWTWIPGIAGNTAGVLIDREHSGSRRVGGIGPLLILIIIDLLMERELLPF